MAFPSIMFDKELSLDFDWHVEQFPRYACLIDANLVWTDSAASMAFPAARVSAHKRRQLAQSVIRLAPPFWSLLEA
jgi:hypothetical protein